jgi:catechol 2,3-dioxygenase-like lactoylglutathione lyase family enzyme
VAFRGVELAQLALEVGLCGHHNLLVTGIARRLRPGVAHCIRSDPPDAANRVRRASPIEVRFGQRVWLNDLATGRRVVGPADDNEAMSHDLPLANIITLGVSDVAGERDFYRRRGWPLVLDTDDFVVFELRGALLALFGADDPRRDARAEPEPGRGGIRSSVIITVDRSEDVDELTERARAAGARITKDPVAAEFFDGRDAYFADPEGNYWEVAWSAGDNPVTAAARRAAGR